MLAATLVQSSCCELQRPFYKPSKWRPALTTALVQSGSYQSGLLLWIKGGGAGGTSAAVCAMAAVGELASWNLECGETLGSKGVGGDLASWNPECGETLWWQHGRGGNGGCDGDLLGLKSGRCGSQRPLWIRVAVSTHSGQFGSEWRSGLTTGKRRVPRTMCDCGGRKCRLPLWIKVAASSDSRDSLLESGGCRCWLPL